MSYVASGDSLNMSQSVDQKQGEYPTQQPPPYSSPPASYPTQAPYAPQAPYPAQASYSAQAGFQQPAYYDPNAPPPQPYYQSQPAVVVQLPQTHGVVMQQVSEIPFRTTCPHCHAEVLTTVEYVTGGLTWLIFGILLAAGCFILITWFFCCIPFCIKSCKDVVHSCPNCHTKLGRKNRL